MKIISKIRNSFKKPNFLKRPFLRRQKIDYDNKNLLNKDILDENNDVSSESLTINEINNNNLTIQNNTDVILPNQNTDKTCSYVCLFIMIVFYYFSIIFKKIKYQINKTN